LVQVPADIVHSAMVKQTLRDQERAVAAVVASLPPDVIGGRLRRAREAQHLSVREAAEAAALSKTSVVRVEKGEEARPITILKLCAALGLHAERLAVPDEAGSVAIHRLAQDRWFDMVDFGAGPLGGQDRPLSESERSEYVRSGARSPLLMLHSRLAQGKVLPSVLELYETSEPRSHPGEEFVYVLAGRAKIGVSGIDYILEEGESIEFWGTEPHSYGPAGEALARVLSVRINP
jgi:transcriptional regulator with XRE-family HTH domain